MILTHALSLFAALGDPCTPSGSVLGFPTWYKYLAGLESISSAGNKTCSVRIVSVNDFWLIGFAVIELMLRFGALVALGFVIYGGIQFVTSEGNSDKAKKALSTVISACVGLAITVGSTAAVTFIAGRFN